jgi:hypothetical protein
MPEKWAVAIESLSERPGMFQLIRGQDGNILVFDSKWAARRWLLSDDAFNKVRNEVVYIKVLSGKSG